MGKRLHVASVYQVKWGKVANFNWKVEEFHNVLFAIGVDCIPVEPDETLGGAYADNFEVSKEEIRRALSELQNTDLIDEEILDEIKDTLKDLYGSNIEGDGIVQFFYDMQKYLAEAEPDSDYLHFSFF